MRQYRIIQTVEPGLPEFSFAQFPPSPSIENELSELMSTRSQIRVMLQDMGPVPTDIADSVTDIIQSSRARREVGEWITNERSLSQKIYHYFSLVGTIGQNITGIDLVLTIEFSNNSTAKYKIIGVNGDADIEFGYVYGSAVDVEGNSLPDTASSFSGRYTFENQGALNDFLNNAEVFNVPVQTQTLGIPLTCSYNARDSVLTCSPHTVSEP